MAGLPTRGDWSRRRRSLGAGRGPGARRVPERRLHPGGRGPVPRSRAPSSFARCDACVFRSDLFPFALLVRLTGGDTWIQSERFRQIADAAFAVYAGEGLKTIETAGGFHRGSGVA